MPSAWLTCERLIERVSTALHREAHVAQEDGMDADRFETVTAVRPRRHLGKYAPIGS